MCKPKQSITMICIIDFGELHPEVNNNRLWRHSYSGHLFFPVLPLYDLVLVSCLSPCEVWGGATIK